MVRSKVGFSSRGTHCSGWLYLPKGVRKPPLILMAHGLAAEKEFGLPVFAEAYARDGYAVYLFDYRNHGGSEGQPRNLVRASRHLQDWEAALARVKRLPNINKDKIILWGTSLSGGHVIVTAARHPEVAAAICHVPFTDGLTALQDKTIGEMLKGAGAGILDAALAWAGVRCTVPVVAEPGMLACLNQPGVVREYTKSIPPESKWMNQCPASIFLTLPLYRPIKLAPLVKCPVLMIKAEEDKIISALAMIETAKSIEQVRLIEIRGGHFDFYEGEIFESLYQKELSFLAELNL